MKARAIIKELYVGVIGWAWIAACVAAVYFLVRAVFYGGSWWEVLGSVAITWLLYRVSLYYVLEKERANGREL
jgi:hypothetical protein